MLRHVCLALLLTHKFCHCDDSIRFSEVRRLSGIAYSEGHNLQHHTSKVLTDQALSKRSHFRWDVNKASTNESTSLKPSSESKKERRKNKKGLKKKKDEENIWWPWTNYEDWKKNNPHTEVKAKPERPSRRQGKGDKNRKGEKKRRKKIKKKRKNRKLKDSIQNHKNVTQLDQKEHKNKTKTKKISVTNLHRQKHSKEGIIFETSQHNEPLHDVDSKVVTKKYGEIPPHQPLHDEQHKYFLDAADEKKIEKKESLARIKFFTHKTAVSFKNNYPESIKNNDTVTFDHYEDNEIRKFYHLFPTWKSSIIKMSQKNFSLDHNECLKDNGGCEGLCINTPGSYHCHCPPGFRLDTSRKNCMDVNECLLRNGHGPCQGECENRWGSYKCGCSSIPGTELSADGRSCRTIDSCSKADCSHLCENTRSGPFCFCPPGFVLASDWKTCEDVNECLQTELQDPKCHGHCTNTMGSYKCSSKV